MLLKCGGAGAEDAERESNDQTKKLMKSYQSKLEKYNII